MGERFTDDTDSPSGEKKKDSKERAEQRWVKPPLIPRSLELSRDSREAPPPAPPPPTLLEQVLGKDLLEKAQDDDEEDKEEEKRPEGAEEQPAETEEPKEEAGPETLEEALQPAAEAEPLEPLEAGTEEVPEEPDETVLHIRREPERPPIEESAITEEAEEPSRPAAAAGGSGAMPPPPPPVGPPPGISPNRGPGYSWDAAPPPPDTSYNRYNVSPPPISAEQYRADLKETERDAEKRGLRRGLVAGFITGYVLKAYLASRKRERYEKATEKQLNERNEQISRLQRDQQQLAEQMAARTEDYRRRQEGLAGNRPSRFEGAAPATNAEALPPQAVRQEEQIFDQEGNEIILQPGWHVERSAGGYSVVLDEHNRVVHDAIHYGEAFKREQQREQLSDDLFGTIGGGATVGGPADGQAAAAQYGASQQAGGSQSSLPAPSLTHEVDLKHRLPEPRNQFITTIASPWLWTAVAILIIIYFVAALA